MVDLAYSFGECECLVRDPSNFLYDEVMLLRLKVGFFFIGVERMIVEDLMSLAGLGVASTWFG